MLGTVVFLVVWLSNSAAPEVDGPNYVGFSLVVIVWESLAASVCRKRLRLERNLLWLNR